jgi:hypothetical protein
MRRPIETSWKALSLAVLLLAAAARLAAQTETGDLYGKVADDKGQPLPGVTITVTGTGAPRVEVSAADGQFHFLGLYPGKYALKAELEGFAALGKEDIEVRLAGKVNLLLTMNPPLTETINVTADRPVLDERQVNRGVSLPASDLNKVPTARDPWSLLSKAPGVQTDRINVGGNESGQQSDFIGLGSGGRDNTFTVDGVVLTDMNSVGASSTYFDFGAFQEVQITVSSSDVTVATSGVTINQVTKRGGNQWAANARYLRTDGNLQASPIFVTSADGSRVESSRIKSVAEYGGDVGGPLLRDRLWIWASEGRSDIKNIAQGGQLDATNLRDFNTKANFQLGQPNSGELHYWTNDKLKFGRDAGATHAPGTTHDQTTPSDIWKVEDTHIFGPSFLLTGLYSHDFGKFTLAPKGGLDDIVWTDQAGVHQGTSFDFKQSATIQQGRLNGSYFFNAGKASNELRFGGSYRQQDNSSGTVWPGGQIVTDCRFAGCDPSLTQVAFPRNRKVAISTSYGSGWVQDTLSLDRLTVNAGVRYDDQKLRNRPTFDAGNPLAQGFLPPINFPGNDGGGFRWRTFVPRVSATYALGADRRTLVRGSFSQYAEQLGQVPLGDRVNPLGYSYAYFYFVDANGNHHLDPSEVGSLVYGFTNGIDPKNPGSIVTANRNDPHLRPAKTDELSLGVEQGFRANTAVGVTFTYRRVHDIPETRLQVLDASGVERLATSADWVAGTPVTATLQNGQTVTVPVYVLDPALTPNGRFYTNGDRTQRYLGATLHFDKRLANHWELNGHLTYADWKWHIGPQYLHFADPTRPIIDDLGYATRDSSFFEQSTGNKSDVLTGSKWSYNAFALYQVAPERPWGFDVGASLTGRQGYPTPPIVTRSGPTGSRQILLASSVDEFRNDNIFLLDGHLGKEFKFNDFGLSVVADGFNLLNSHPVLQRQRNVEATSTTNPPVSTFNTIEEVLSPRVLRLGLIVHFR